jgi:hypothetical protein
MKSIRRELILVIIIFIFSIIIMISCSQKHEASMFLIEGNITGLDIDIIFGGYDPSLVEEKLVIPTVEHIARLKDIEAIKYQISPTYFRIFLKTDNYQDDAVVYSQLLDLVDKLPNLTEIMEDREELEKYLIKMDDNEPHIVTGNKSVFRNKDEYLLSGEPLVLPIASTVEPNLSSIIPDMRAKQLTIRFDRGRLAQFGINFNNLSDIVSAKYFKLSGNDSLLLIAVEDLKDLPLSEVPNAEGQYVLLGDIAQFEYVIAGIDRPWTPTAEFR